MATSSKTEPESQLLHLGNPSSSTLEEENHQQQPQTLQTLDRQAQEQEHDDQKQDDSHISDQQIDREDQEQQSGNSLTISDPLPPPITSPTNPSRRYTNKRKKGIFNVKKQQAIDKKVQTLTENFNPVPFRPSKFFDFPKHEKLLKHLGLWSFVHIDFNQEIRVDLVAQLIASYDKTQRGAYVKGNRITVARPDLARALLLPPIKKQKANPSEGVDLDSEFASDECKSFLEDFVSNWVLLHEDTWMMPDEVLNMIRPIKELQPEKVDWSSLFWFMVEKELSQGLKLTDCYYASHLQYLIKSQKAEIVMEELNLATKGEVKEEEKPCELEVKEEANPCDIEVKKEANPCDIEVKEEANPCDIEVKKEANPCDIEVKEEANPCDIEVKEEANPCDIEVKEEANPCDIEVKAEANPCDIEVKEEADPRDVEIKEANTFGLEVKEGGDLKMGSVNESEGQDGNKPNTDLTLGQDKMEKEEVKEEDGMNIDESKEDEKMSVDESKEEEPRQHGWLFDEKNDMGHRFLQPCQIEEESRDLDSNEEQRKMEVEEEEVDDDDDEEIEEVEEEEEEEMEDGFPIDPNENGPDPDGLTGNLLQGMEENHISFGLQRQLHDQFQSEVFPSRSNMHTISAGPSFGGKQELLHDYEHDMLKHNVIGSNKRMRTENLWDQEPSDMGTIMEQIQHLAEKAKIMYGSKEQTNQEANINQQILINEIQQRDRTIEHLHKKCEELQRKDSEIFKLERELFMVTNLLEGYRKALKETNKNFFEYRQRAQLPEEPVYKDAGPGGVVLGPVELEKQRVKQEEEDRLHRLIIVQKLKEVEDEWICKFTVELDKIQMMDERLMGFENEVKLMKELCDKKKNVPEVSECGPSTSVVGDDAELLA